jgi:hypothetical protein
MITKRNVVAVGSTKPPREYKVRLPFDLAEEIEYESGHSGIPQNRIIVDRLNREKAANDIRTMNDLIEKLILAGGDLNILIARYGSRMDSIDLGEELPEVIDEVLNAKPAELPAKLDKLRLVRSKMRNIERKKREQAAFSKVAREKVEKKRTA